ncbi:variable surface protein [Plasmodium gonderi]|uniref:Variable surface protein n=1 Tax=Plasmodium gonderi TaxID=77519 RepID=A0A1Y1JRN2_PLAGO|nr:variable surface protein [Plasmodium gonderi]GAW84145.1 variable surface protein [Plasmodium gonderi]
MPSSTEKDRIYIYVDLFDKKKGIYEECKTKYKEQSLNNYCDQVNSVDRNGINDFDNTCPYIIDCIYDQKEDGEKINDHVCIYLYYWLYENYYKNEGDFENVKKRYEVYLKAYANYQHSICDYYKNNFTDVILKKLKDIYDMNTELGNIKNSKGPCSSSKCKCAKKFYEIYNKYVNDCKSNNDRVFCKALKKYIGEYNKQMANGNSCNGIPEFLPLFQTYNIKVYIIIPIVAALMITLFIFIMYKFTILGSCLQNRIIIKRNLRNNLYNECNILQESQMSCSNLRNRIYYILYSSD